MTSPAAISVVMPVFNGARFLDRSLASLRTQTFSDWELLAVDDASTDDSAARLDAFAAADSRVRVFRHTVNKGCAAGRNTALKAARGEWIAYLDCDDEFYPDHFAHIVDSRYVEDVLIFAYDVREEQPGVPGVGGTYRHDPSALREQLLAFGNIATPVGVVHRRDLLDRVGLFDERLSFEDDAEMWRRMVRGGARVAFVSRPSGVYHARPDSLARDHFRKDASPELLPSRIATTKVGPFTLRLPEAELWVVGEVFERHEYGGLAPHLLRKPPVIVDVGANVGLFTLYAKFVYHRDSIVHCFEPYPPTATLLQQNVGSVSGVHVYPVGLGARDESVTMYLNPVNSGANSLRCELVPHPAGSALVPIRDAAEVWDALKLGEVDVLKLDAEGAEPAILERLAERLKHVRFVLIEYHTSADRRRMDALLSGHELFATSLHEPGRGVVKYIRSDLVARGG